MIKPRDYQLKAHDEIVNEFRKGNNRLLLVMPTGAGKSKTAFSFIEKYKSFYKFVVCVRTRDLVNQLEDDAKLFNLSYGVYMAGHTKYDPSKTVQLCSIDTLDSRKLYPHRWEENVILIIDEADQSEARQYQEVIDVYCNRKFKAKPEGVNSEIREGFLLGMTATPYNKLSSFQKYIAPITAKELNKRGILVDYKYYIPKSSVNYDNIKLVNGGKFSEKDLVKELNNPNMIKECFNSWLEFGDNRKTLVFCVNQNHAKAMNKYINEYYGRSVSMFVDANTPEDFRKKIYNDFNNGTLNFLVNVRIVTRGKDLPNIGTILDCQPTESVNLHIQKMGRGSRKNDFYTDCIYIDPAKNLLNNGHFYQDREINLEVSDKRKKSEMFKMDLRSCEKCFRVYEGLQRQCPYCGNLNAIVKKPKLSKAQKEKLFMESASPEAIEQRQMIKEFNKHVWQLQNLSKKSSGEANKAAHFKLLKKHGVDKVRPIKNTIGLSESRIKYYIEVIDYKPLGGI